MISFCKKYFKILKIKFKFYYRIIIDRLKKKFSLTSNFVLNAIVLIVVFSVIFANPKFLFYISSNLRQADYKNDLIRTSMSLFNIYNSKNYILDKVVPEEIVEVKKPEYSEYEILDNEMSNIDQVDVFNKSLEVNIIKDTASYQKLTVGNVEITNYSYIRDIDYASLITSSDVILTKKSDKILLYNTHTSETYSNSEKFVFDYTGICRTTDANYNMLRIAKEFNANLNEKGFISIQDTTPHDYGAYTSAYKNSRESLANDIASYGGFGIAIDVHRDAIEDLSFRPFVNIKGVNIARAMFVIGAGTRDYENQYFEANLKLALKLQYIAEQVYPGLFRSIIIRDSVYNQDVNKYSLLIEVGATGNSIEEAIMTTRCITNLLNIIYKD